MTLSVSDIRRRNLARLFHALRRRPGSSQRELVEATGVDQGTVSVIVKQLEGLGVLERAPRPSGGRVGRPETELRIAHGAGVLAGVSLEPDSIALVVATLDGEELARSRVAGSRDVGEALGLAIAALERCVADLGYPLSRVHGLGVGVPAILSDDGVAVLAPNLGWREVAVRSRLEALTDIPSYVDNDSNAATLAEQLFGGHDPARHAIYLNGHSGVGGGLYLGGDLYRGAHGFAGEIGHLKVVEGGRACGCGGRGCLETYVSGRALLARFEALGRPLPDLRAALSVVDAGDAEVDLELREAAEVLGLALANLTNLLDPGRVVLGGSLAALLEAHPEAIRSQLDRHALPGFAVEVLPSRLGEAAVPLGGVALALEGLFGLMIGPAERFRSDDATIDEGVTS